MNTDVHEHAKRERFAGPIRSPTPRRSGRPSPSRHENPRSRKSVGPKHDLVGAETAASGFPWRETEGHDEELWSRQSNSNASDAR